MYGIIFQLDIIEVKYSDSEDAPEKTKEDCAPGNPHISFFVETGVLVDLINPQPQSGLFSVNIKLFSGDTIAKLKNKLSKEVKSIKNGNLLTLKSLNKISREGYR